MLNLEGVTVEARAETPTQYDYIMRATTQPPRLRLGASEECADHRGAEKNRALFHGWPFRAASMASAVGFSGSTLRHSNVRHSLSVQ